MARRVEREEEGGRERDTEARERVRGGAGVGRVWAEHYDDVLLVTGGDREIEEREREGERRGWAGAWRGGMGWSGGGAGLGRAPRRRLPRRCRESLSAATYTSMRSKSLYMHTNIRYSCIYTLYMQCTHICFING
jgi:hypothetical protein